MHAQGRQAGLAAMANALLPPSAQQAAFYDQLSAAIDEQMRQVMASVAMDQLGAPPPARDAFTGEPLPTCRFAKCGQPCVDVVPVNWYAGKVTGDGPLIMACSRACYDRLYAAAQAKRQTEAGPVSEVATSTDPAFQAGDRVVLAPAPAPACKGGVCGKTAGPGESLSFPGEIFWPDAVVTYGDGGRGTAYCSPGCRDRVAAATKPPAPSVPTCAGPDCSSTGPFVYAGMCWPCADYAERSQGLARRVSAEIHAEIAAEAEKAFPRPPAPRPEPYRPPVTAGLDNAVGKLWRGREP